jgi:hypothetical protein
MKYIFIPIGRTIFVLTVLIMFPLIFICVCCYSLWEWNTKEIKDLFHAMTNNFHSELDGRMSYVRPGDQYWVYPTPLDYIRGRKYYRTKPIENQIVIPTIRRSFIRSRN